MQSWDSASVSTQIAAHNLAENFAVVIFSCDVYRPNQKFLTVFGFKLSFKKNCHTPCSLGLGHLWQPQLILLGLHASPLSRGCRQ